MTPDPLPDPTLRDVLLSRPTPGAGLVALSLPAPGAVPKARVRRGSSLLAALLPAARIVLRQPRARQLALRILKHFPGLYARAYRMMMAPAAGNTQATAREPDQGLSPRAAAILRTLRAPTHPGQRRRLALVTPLPPARTGVATYALELLEALSAWFDIELVVDQQETALPAPFAHLPVRTAAWFAEHGASYDQVLYQVGNSPLHSHMFALMARYPGVVVLHDFFIGSALVHAHMSGATPGAWTDALLEGHGYEAVRASTDPQNNAMAHQTWPASLAVLEHATRVIVHSQHARQLALDWYGPAAARHIDVIPHPRTAPAMHDRQAARAALGIAADCFLVCSFGFVAPNKLTQELLRAWRLSAAGQDSRCMLVLVGANHDSPYGVQVDELIRSGSQAATIRIAGWTDAAVYSQYLQAADVGVQLRTNARGESSGAVLDCMNYGLATIVNANGSMAEFPRDAVWQLPDAFDVAELAAAIDTLRTDTEQRQALGRHAVALLDSRFRPDACARQYRATLDLAMAATVAQRQTAPADDGALAAYATKLAEQGPALRRQLLVDISDWASGSVAPRAQAQLLELLALEDAGLHVEPVWLDTTGPLPRYRQARNATGRLLGLTWPAQEEPVVDVHDDAIYFAPDGTSPAVATAIVAGLFAAWRARGVTVNVLLGAGQDGAALAGSADRLLTMTAYNSA